MQHRSQARTAELQPPVCETLRRQARSLAFQVLLDPIIEFTSGSLVGAETVSRNAVDKEDFAFVVPASVTTGALVAVAREVGGEPRGGRSSVRRLRGRPGRGRSQVDGSESADARCGPHAERRRGAGGVRESVVAAASESLGALLR